MKLLEYCYETVDLLEKVEIDKFAALYVQRRSQVFGLYNQGLVTSTAHGIDFFSNVIKYIDRPEDYKETKKGDEEYEKNFREILKRNK